MVRPVSVRRASVRERVTGETVALTSPPPPQPPSAASTTSRRPSHRRRTPPPTSPPAADPRLRSPRRRPDRHRPYRASTAPRRARRSYARRYDPRMWRPGGLVMDDPAEALAAVGLVVAGVQDERVPGHIDRLRRREEVARVRDEVEENEHLVEPESPPCRGRPRRPARCAGSRLRSNRSEDPDRPAGDGRTVSCCQGSRTQEAAHVASQVLRGVSQLQVGDGYTAPAGRLEDAALLPVALEGGPRPVGLPAVHLDDQALFAPYAVHLEALYERVRLGGGARPARFSSAARTFLAPERRGWRSRRSTRRRLVPEPLDLGFVDGPLPAGSHRGPQPCRRACGGPW